MFVLYVHQEVQLHKKDDLLQSILGYVQYIGLTLPLRIDLNALS
jgi:hypothetical protein